MKRIITKEELEHILTILYPGGYGKDNTRSDYSDDWYIGWLGVNNVSQAGLPMETNIDGQGTYIIFMWWSQFYEKMTNDEIAGYIQGVMSLLMPDMTADDRKVNATSIGFKFNEK